VKNNHLFVCGHPLYVQPNLKLAPQLMQPIWE
jgi:hypothetical protein